MAVRFLEFPLIIADGATTSAAIELRGAIPVAVLLPAEFDGLTLTPNVSLDGVTYYGLFDDAGAAVVITAAASRWIALLPQEYAGIDWLRFVAGVQAGATTITLLVRTD